MNRTFRYLIDTLTMVEPTERRLVGWSFINFFCLLSGYFILRPVRDEMGIVNGASNMQWLFTGTFIAMLLVVPIFGYLIKKKPVKIVLNICSLFFIINVLLFYLFFEMAGQSKVLAISFFIWLSVFNLFTISLFWSFMVDVFSSVASKRLFGLISAGGSLGALAGPLISSYVARKTSIENLLLIAIGFLLMAYYSMTKVSLLKDNRASTQKNIGFAQTKIIKGGVWNGVKKTFSSKYLIGIVLFIGLYTSVSTFLYFEQGHILENTIPDGNKRLTYFSNMDLLTNSLAIFGQLLLTNRIIRRFGLAITLASIPFLVGIGLTVMSTSVTLPVIASILVIHRAGNFALIRPGREILFTVGSVREKYQAKNFIDTTIYRGGDALTGWLFTAFLSLGFGLASVALIAASIAMLWSFLGYTLGKKQIIKEKEQTLNKKPNAKC